MAKREIEIIRKTISILDSVDYKRYSEGKANAYLEYVSGAWTDERKLIAPILFPKFLEQILDFKLGETIGTQETTPEGRDIPDYIPTDTRTHVFVFDCKGMDTFDLSKWYSQIKRYIEAQELKYGILVNMRDLDVYTIESKEELESFNFNFVELYKDFREDVASILTKENTKRFLRFVEHFSYTPLTIEEKFKKVAVAKPWTGAETLNIDLLTKRLHYIVECIYEDAGLSKEKLFSLAEVDPERAKAIAQEIEIIASEIERGRKIGEASLETFEEILNASPQSLWVRALDIFFYRVGYFTMTRLLLARTWEDIGFIDQSLYNGGLAKWYENFSREIRWVLKHAFDLAAERYKWLFNVDNNYSWYEPSDETLIEVLYELSNFYLGKLDQDVLGTIYEEYIDRVDKKQKGQYYTPREIVEFIWDRVGFVKEDSFHYEAGKREPRLIFDPVAGSGGFLVEAARRIRGDPKLNYADFNDMLDIRTAILTGIFGSEISPFPYYITEVNLLIQLTPVIKRMMDMQRNFRGRGTPALGIVPIDALYLYNPEQLTLEKEEYDFDQTRDLLPLDSQKRTIFQKIKKTHDGKFSYCCANPPYIGEKGNKELFRTTIARFPYWGKFYQGKMDYLYFFIILGLSKLRDYGKLGFITTAYWPTADGASGLRKYILKNAKIKEMIFFEDVKIFEYARGQHNMVFVLEKFPGEEKEQERAENRIKVVRVLAKHQEIPGNTIREKLKFLTEHIRKHIDESEWEDEYIRVFWSGVRQGELTEGAWNLVDSEMMWQLLQTMQKRGDPLHRLCKISVGTLTAADKVTKQNIKWLTEENTKKSNIKIGDGIFILSESEYESLNYSGSNIKPFFKNSDISPYIIAPDKPNLFIYATEKIKNDPICMAHLSKFEELLKHSKKVRDEQHIPWYELPREKSPELFDGPKIVTPNRAPKNTFGYSEQPYYGVSDIFVIVKRKETKEDLKYILGLLNSKLLNFWTSNKNKSKGDTLEFVGTPLSQIPIRRIDFSNLEDVKLHNGIVEKVKAIINKMAELASHSKYFKGARLSRLKFDDPPPDMNPEAIVQALPPEKRFSLRTHPEIKITYSPDSQETQFILNRVGDVSHTLEGPEIRLYGKDRKALFLRGPEAFLRLIAQILESHQGEAWTSIKERDFIPEKPEEFEAQKQRTLETVATLRGEIQELQDSIDRIVFGLYGVPETQTSNIIQT